MINDLRTQVDWKIQISMAVNIFSSKDSNETRTMPLKRDNIELMIDN